MARYIIEFNKVQTMSVAIEADNDLEAEKIAHKLLDSDYVEYVDYEFEENYEPDWYTVVNPAPDGQYTDESLTQEEVSEYIGEMED